MVPIVMEMSAVCSPPPHGQLPAWDTHLRDGGSEAWKPPSLELSGRVHSCRARGSCHSDTGGLDLLRTWPPSPGGPQGSASLMISQTVGVSEVSRASSSSESCPLPTGRSGPSHLREAPRGGETRFRETVQHPNTGISVRAGLLLRRRPDDAHHTPQPAGGPAVSQEAHRSVASRGPVGHLPPVCKGPVGHCMWTLGLEPVRRVPHGGRRPDNSGPEFLSAGPVRERPLLPLIRQLWARCCRGSRGLRSVTRPQAAGSCLRFCAWARAPGARHPVNE